MSDPWFFHRPPPSAAADLPLEVQLDPAEARHASGSRRLRPGTAIVLTDGAGVTAQATISTVDRNAVSATVRAVRTHAAPTPRIHVAAALPKGDRATTMLGMATQLGMDHFTPLRCERSVVVPRDNASERWERVIREAGKQCQRPHFPTIGAASSLDDLLGSSTLGSSTLGSSTQRRRVFLLAPDGARRPALGLEPAPEEYLLVIGPEGGFTRGEKAQVAESGGEGLCVGPYILRTETAVAAAISFVAAQQCLEPKDEGR